MFRDGVLEVDLYLSLKPYFREVVVLVIYLVIQSMHLSQTLVSRTSLWRTILAYHRLFSYLCYLLCSLENELRVPWVIKMFSCLSLFWEMHVCSTIGFTTRFNFLFYFYENLSYNHEVSLHLYPSVTEICPSLGKGLTKLSLEKIPTHKWFLIQLCNHMSWMIRHPDYIRYMPIILNNKGRNSKSWRGGTKKNPGSWMGGGSTEEITEFDGRTTW